MVNINGNVMVLLSQAHCILNYSQRPKAQKIHLQKSQLLNGRHGKLGRDRTVCRP